MVHLWLPKNTVHVIVIREDDVDMGVMAQLPEVYKRMRSSCRIDRHNAIQYTHLLLFQL